MGASQRQPEHEEIFTFHEKILKFVGNYTFHRIPAFCYIRASKYPENRDNDLPKGPGSTGFHTPMNA
jgi:hypothetical protein